MLTATAHRWLDDQHEAMIADLVRLCDQNSGSENLAGLNQMADLLESWANLAPATFTRIALPDRSTLDSQGNPVKLPSAPALRWDHQLDRPRRVLLAIHYDTVFSPQDGFQKCVRLDRDRLNGPGVADAKGGIVVLRYALQALVHHQLAPDLGWTLILNPDEELGSPSSAGLWHELAPHYDFGLLFEPALPNGGLVSHRKGSGNFTIRIKGRSAHAGRHFDQGRNAIGEISRVVAELDALNGQRAETTINIGHIQGGGALNIVPELALAGLNVRAADLESAEWFESCLRSLAAKTSAKEGFAIDVHGSFQSPPKPKTAAQERLMRCVEQCASNLGQPIHWHYTGGVCDGNKLAAAGLPNIDTLGPRGDGLHSSAEQVALSSLLDKAKLLLEILSRHARGELAWDFKDR